MDKLNHWVSELPDLGVSYTIIRLVDEQREAKETIEFLQNRLGEIDREIMETVKSAWNKDEITEAQAAFNRR